MDNNYTLIFLITLLLFLIYRTEYFGGGALMQLVAYGAQDIYLTGGNGRPADPYDQRSNIRKY